MWKLLRNWVGVAAGVAEGLGVNRYAERVVFEEFVPGGGDVKAGHASLLQLPSDYHSVLNGVVVLHVLVAGELKNNWKILLNFSFMR